jgi:hypothetical protein
VIPSILIVLGCAIFGAVLDFLVNGVLKIVWAVVYIPVYIAIANGLHSRIKRNGIIAFFCGAAFIHLVFDGRTQTLTYKMDIIEPSPLQLGSSEWSQRLFVESPSVQKKLGADTSKAQVEVSIVRETTYGCTVSSYVKTVAGIDVKTDPASTWVWKKDKNDPTPTKGPGAEDAKLGWCRLKFYQSW